MLRIRNAQAITLAAVLGLKRMVVLAHHKYIPHNWLEKTKRKKEKCGARSIFWEGWENGGQWHKLTT